MKFRAGKANPMYRPALERFAEKCRFDARTGCVLWTGGTTAGRGNSARYGSFWYEGARWFAHRWSAVFIKGIDPGINQIGHTCPRGPNSLCVEHVEAQTQLENLKEQNDRMRLKAQQTAQDRKYWLFVALEIEPAPKVQTIPDNAPDLYEPPEWFKPYCTWKEIECPF